MNKAYNFRLSDETIEQLDFLCGLVGTNRTACIVALIAGEYDRYQGNPKMKAVLSQLQDLEAQMKSVMRMLPGNE